MCQFIDPVLTYSGPLIAGVITGAFIIGQIFAVPGMGKHLVNSVTNRDYPLILGTTLVFSLRWWLRISWLICCTLTSIQGSNCHGEELKPRKAGSNSLWADGWRRLKKELWLSGPP